MHMPNFVVLLAPSEEMKTGGNPFAPDMFDYRSSDTFNYFSRLNPERRALIDRLQEAIRSSDEAALGEIFGIAGASLKDAKDTMLGIYSAPLMSALDRYSPGVMYASMDFPGLPTGAQRRLLENGIVLSGLFGLLRPDDLIPIYRLAMHAKVPGIGAVSEYWRPHISSLLNEAIRGRFVWDLLPETHRAAWDDDHAYAQRVHVEFLVNGAQGVELVQGDRESLCGQLVNFIVRETAEGVDSFLNWEHPGGYRYDESRSAYNDGTRTATIAMVKE